LYQFITRYN